MKSLTAGQTGAYDGIIVMTLPDCCLRATKCNNSRDPLKRIAAFPIEYLTIHLRITRILIRNILCAQTSTRHGRLAFITLVGRNVASIAQIATATNLDIGVLIQDIKGDFDLSARHAHRESGVALAGKHCGAAFGSGREEIAEGEVVA